MVKKIDKKIIITIVAISIIVAFVGWFALFYETGKVKETAETIQKKKLESIVAQEKRDKIALLNKELVDMESFKGEMEKMLIGKDDAVPLLRSLEEMAAKTSNVIKIEAADLSKLKTSQKSSNDLDEDAATKKMTREEQVAADVAAEKAKQEGSGKIKDSLGFTIELSGTFPAAVDFIDGMENLPYFINVYNMDIATLAKEKKLVESGGVLAAGSPSSDSGSPPENKNVKTTMLIIVSVSNGK